MGADKKYKYGGDKLSSYSLNNKEELVRIVTKLVLEQLKKEGLPPLNSGEISLGCCVKEMGDALPSVAPDEVVVGLAPAFGAGDQQTINGLSHKQILREISAGVEEEGLKARFIKVYDTADTGFIGLTAAKFSGSGIGIGIQSKGTTVIHQKDLYPLTNLELFPQAPLLTLETYRLIGKNAARYAKGQSPVPISSENDYMVRPKYQAKAALMHIKESALVRDLKPKLLEVDFNEPNL